MDDRYVRAAYLILARYGSEMGREIDSFLYLGYPLLHWMPRYVSYHGEEDR